VAVGRRALPKIDPTLDLTVWLTTFERLPRPWDPQALFGRVAPLAVEVGSGKGLFLRTEALRQPEVDFLGIEIADPYARFAAASLAKHQIPNAAVVAGDALRIFAEVFPDRSLAAVHVYFPDPWWKKRHKKRRVMRESFLRDVARTLCPGGLLHFWTDVEEYFVSTLELIAATTTLGEPLPVELRPAEHDMDYRTHFERRMRLNDEPVYRAVFRKAADPAP
jgi:tRNA (guanine-N7-)-methyltransferase